MTFRELSNIDYEKFVRRQKTIMKENKNKCCICHRNLSANEEFSALPIKDGICCRTCYREVVSPVIMCGKTLEDLKNGGFGNPEKEKEKAIKESVDAIEDLPDSNTITYDDVNPGQSDSMFDDENVLIDKAPSIDQTKNNNPIHPDIDYANEVDPDFIGKDDNDDKINKAINDSFFNEDGTLNGNKIL